MHANKLKFEIEIHADFSNDFTNNAMSNFTWLIVHDLRLVDYLLGG